MAYMACRSGPTLRRDCLPGCVGFSFLSVEIRLRFQRFDYKDEVRRSNLDTRDYSFGERVVCENKGKNGDTYKFRAGSDVLPLSD